MGDLGSFRLQAVVLAILEKTTDRSLIILNMIGTLDLGPEGSVFDVNWSIEQAENGRNKVTINGFLLMRSSKNICPRPFFLFRVLPLFSMQEVLRVGIFCDCRNSI